METKTNKPNPRRILGYLMAFAMVFCTTAYTFAQDVVITVGGGSFDSECSFDITDVNGVVLVPTSGAGIYTATLVDGECYDMNMYDSWGDGWDNYTPSTYTIADASSGYVYATGSLADGLASGTDNFCMVAPPSCTLDEVTLNLYDLSLIHI